MPMKMACESLRNALRVGVLLVLLGSPWLAGAANTLNWRKNQNRVDAEITNWDLNKLLEELAAATDWQIYLEPNAKHTVSTKFKDRPPGEALPMLLGDLGYALLPQTNGPSKLFVFRTSLQEATQLVRPPPKFPHKEAKPIPNELVVTLKKGANIDDLARRLGAKVLGRADNLSTYRLQFETAEAAAAARELLKSDNEVRSIQSNYAVPRDPSGEGLSYSSIPSLNLKPKAVGNADRLIVGLIDTAVHPQGSGLDGLMLPGISVSGETTPISDQITHGDTMAQTILQSVAAAKESADGTRVRILPVDVYGGNPSTTMYEIALGVTKAIDSGANIINLSLGGEGDSEILHDVIRRGHDQGVVFIAAAGNEPTTQPTYPAAWPEVIAVTAGDRRGQIASYANRGDFVDVVAPGSSIVTREGQAYLVTGTSVSTATFTGAIAGQTDASGRKLPDILAGILKTLSPKP